MVWWKLTKSIPTSSRLVNISTRGRVGTLNEPMIGGLIAQGGAAKKVIIRALGPSLGTGVNAVSGALADPVLELRDASGNLVAVNDDWSSGSQVAAILSTGIPPVESIGVGNRRHAWRPEIILRSCAAWMERPGLRWWKCSISTRIH